MSGASSRSRRRIARWARARESSIQPTSSLWSASGKVDENARTFEFSLSWVCHRRATATKGGAAYMTGTTARILTARAFAPVDRTPLSGRRRGGGGFQGGGAFLCASFQRPTPHFSPDALRG